MMKNRRPQIWALLAILSLFLLLSACGSGASDDGASTTQDSMGMDHEHDEEEAREWDGEGVPSIALTVSGDNASGWTGTVELENFVLDPMDMMDHVPGHGHAHVMLDGQLWNMVHTPTFVIPQLDPGSHVIMVSLSSNDHMDYVLAGVPIRAMATVEVAGEVETADVIIDAAYVDGEVAVDPSSPAAIQGDIVELRVTSDSDEEVHVHGYDIMTVVGPQQPATVRFQADVPGIFEVELEQSGTLLFNLTGGQP
ncbi:MAG: hypothetical protein WBM90_09755 [Acidimicrobiia bacterium]